ncbi:hypothetical protein Y1Q_0000002 [Alligator mississippiensis]|uniref:Uncharacterized protein n=1 Tax=Alligator mississippiensis TaxID=8496 RepID=A0A151P0W0_ALLMI|nr:hypothetical protein Y1Q_0000002 [Alligator mississippiensis]
MVSRAYGRYSGPLTDAVYEEIDYNLMREKLEMFGCSVSYSEDSVMKLQYYTGDSEDGNDPGSAQEETSPGDFQQDYDSVEEPEWSDIPVPPDGKDKSESTASPDRTEPPQRPSLTGGRDMVPIVICIVLGALLCLVLIVLGGQVQSTRALRRASGRYSGPLTDAVYEEIDYNLMREKLEMFGRSAWKQTSVRVRKGHL